MTDEIPEPAFGLFELQQEIDELRARLLGYEGTMRRLRVRQGILERVFLMMFKDPETLSDKVIDIWKAERKKK